jgi:hypothetical protein
MVAQVNQEQFRELHQYRRVRGGLSERDKFARWSYGSKLKTDPAR